MADKNPFLDFKAIKERVSFAHILARYGIELKRVNQSTLKGNCCLPSHTSKSTDTLYVNLEKQVFYCHSDSCQKNGHRAGGNILDFAQAMNPGFTAYGAAKLLDEWFPANGNPAELVNVPAKKADDQTCVEPGTATNKPLAFALKGVNPVHPFIQGKGISAETAALFGIGYFPGAGSMKGRVVFKLHENGSLVGYAGRSIDGSEPKWLLGKGLIKSFVYSLERCDPKKPLLLSEGFWAPAFFHERGLQAASLMGSEMSDTQERCLEPFPRITVAFDDDEAGKEKAARICERLKRKHRVLKARLIE